MPAEISAAVPSDGIAAPAVAGDAPAPAVRATATAGRAPFDPSIIEGPLLPAVWRIAWPTMSRRKRRRRAAGA